MIADAAAHLDPSPFARPPAGPSALSSSAAGTYGCTYDIRGSSWGSRAIILCLIPDEQK